MCYIVFISRIQRPLRPASVFSMMMMMKPIRLFLTFSNSNKFLKALMLGATNSTAYQTSADPLVNHFVGKIPSNIHCGPCSYEFKRVTSGL